MPENPEEERTVVGIDGVLYVADRGTVRFKAFRYSHQPSDFNVEIWNTKSTSYIWIGSPTEFWNLILRGLPSKPKKGK